MPTIYDRPGIAYASASAYAMSAINIRITSVRAYANPANAYDLWTLRICVYAELP